VDLKDALLYKVRHAVSKIEWLDWEENVIADYTSYENDGNITFEKSSDIKRTSSISLINNLSQFVPYGSIVNMKAKYRLWTGINVLGNEFLYQKGVFVLGDPEAINSSEGQSITINGSDKWALIDGKMGGVLADTYQIPAGTDIITAMKSLLQLYGETKFNLLQMGIMAPYTITKDAGGTVADLVKELALIMSYEVSYDQYGVFTGHPIIDALEKIVAWDYGVAYRNLITDIRRNPGWSKIFNYVKVVGATESGKTYKGVARDDNIDSPTYVANPPLGIGQKAKNITANELYSDEQCVDRAKFELTQGLKADDRVTLKIVPNPSHEDDEVISLNDESTGAIGNHEIQRISESLDGTDMTLEVWRVR